MIARRWTAGRRRAGRSRRSTGTGRSTCRMYQFGLIYGFLNNEGILVLLVADLHVLFTVFRSAAFQNQSIHIPINRVHATFDKSLVGTAEAFAAKEWTVCLACSQRTGVRSGNNLMTILH